MVTDRVVPTSRIWDESLGLRIWGVQFDVRAEFRAEVEVMVRID